MSTAVDTAGTLTVEWCTTGEAARRLGRSRKTVWRWCVEGRCPAHQVFDGDWRVSAEWVRAEQRRMRSIRDRASAFLRPKPK